MQKVVIIGKGSLPKLLYYYLRADREREVIAFSVDRAYMQAEQEEFCGCPVFPLETLTCRFPPETCSVMLGIGYTDMNRTRQHLFERCKKMGYTIESYIHPTAIVAENVQMGEGNIILENTVVQPFVTIGKGNLFWYSVSVAHDDIIGDFNTLAGGTTLSGGGSCGGSLFSWQFQRCA